jgi:hypothetical protein
MVIESTDRKCQEVGQVYGRWSLHTFFSGSRKHFSYGFTLRENQKLIQAGIEPKTIDKK